MSADALPYTLLIILAEFTIGGLLYIAMTPVLASEVLAKGTPDRHGGPHLMRPPREETIWPAQ